MVKEMSNKPEFTVVIPAVENASTGALSVEK